MVKKGLGRGLGALLNDADEFLMEFEERESKIDSTKSVEINIEDIVRNEEQPRKTFDDNSMNDLINSIKTHGIITPIIVVKKDAKFMIIAGERRWRAAKNAGLSTVPAIVRNYSPIQIKEISLIENIQREDLNPIDTANAVKQLMQECKYTQEAVADRIGKSRSVVANLLGLLTLQEDVIDLIAKGRLSTGHAKVLTGIPDKNAQLELALKGVDGKLSVRKFEELIKEWRKPKSESNEVKNQSPELKNLIERMQRALGTKVSAIGHDHKGRIYIDYYSRDDLDRLTEIIELVEKNNV